MDLFAQNLRSQMQKAFGQKLPWGDVNPLVVIGLTEAILDLELTEGQMYAIIRSYGRQLAAQIHPDRKPTNVSLERQGQILNAFNFLDNNENFVKALSDFRNFKADDRREVKILTKTVSALRRQIEGFESQIWQIREERENLEKERLELKKEWLRYERHKKKEPLFVPKLLAKVRQLKEDNDILEARVRNFVAKREDLSRQTSKIRKDLASQYGIWRKKKEWEITFLKEKLKSEKRKINAVKRENSAVRKQNKSLIAVNKRISAKK